MRRFANLKFRVLHLLASLIRSITSLGKFSFLQFSSLQLLLFPLCNCFSSNTIIWHSFLYLISYRPTALIKSTRTSMVMTCPPTLIILPCHSIWKVDGPTLGVDHNEWFLEDYQIVGQDHLVFRSQIIDSLSMLQQHKDSFLIISGGATKKEAGPISEAITYFQLAKKLCHEDASLLARINIEEYARDSFENVLFLLCRFYELFNAYPENLVIVGFEFKEKRFVLHHLEQALCFPRDKVKYVGSLPITDHLPEDARKRYCEELHSSELKNALRHFEHDWYGLSGSLKEKRHKRNPFSRYHGYMFSNPKLSDFLITLHESTDTQQTENETIRELISLAPWVNK